LFFVICYAAAVRGLSPLRGCAVGKMIDGILEFGILEFEYLKFGI